MIHKPTVNHIFDEKFKHGLDIIGLPADVMAWLQGEPLVYIHPYAELGGRPVRYQDPEGTVPVADIGDPVAAVVQPSLTLPPAEWPIVVTQTIDSARPLWGGENVGDVYDGTQYLRAAGPFSLVPDNPISVVARATREADSARSILSWSWGTTQAQMGLNLRGLSNQRAQLILGGDNAGQSLNEAYPVTSDRRVIAGRSDGVASQVLLDGTQIASGAPGSLVPGEGDEDEITIGAWDRGGSPTHHWVGVIGHVAIFESYLSDAEIGALS